MKMKKRMPISELLEHVADEVRAADHNATESGDPIMHFTECEVEVGFDVETAADGKVKLFAVELGASGTQTAQHRIKLKYLPNPGRSFQGSQKT